MVDGKLSLFIQHQLARANNLTARRSSKETLTNGKPINVVPMQVKQQQYVVKG